VRTRLLAYSLYLPKRISVSYKNFKNLSDKQVGEMKQLIEVLKHKLVEVQSDIRLVCSIVRNDELHILGLWLDQSMYSVLPLWSRPCRPEARSTWTILSRHTHSVVYLFTVLLGQALGCCISDYYARGLAWGELECTIFQYWAARSSHWAILLSPWRFAFVTRLVCSCHGMFKFWLFLLVVNSINHPPTRTKLKWPKFVSFKRRKPR